VTEEHPVDVAVKIPTTMPLLLPEIPYGLPGLEPKGICSGASCEYGTASSSGSKAAIFYEM
jgi:hypothetical protein